MARLCCRPRSGTQVAISQPVSLASLPCSYIHTAAYGHFGRNDKPEVSFNQ